MEFAQFKQDWKELEAKSTPEKLLLCAVIWRGVIDAVAEVSSAKLAWSDTSKVHQHVRREARFWIFNRSVHPFSFEWCVQHVFENSDAVALEIRKQVARVADDLEDTIAIDKYFSVLND